MCPASKQANLSLLPRGRLNSKKAGMTRPLCNPFGGPLRSIGVRAGLLHPGRPEIVPPIVDKNTSVFDWIENSVQKGKPSRRTPIWLVTTFHTYPEPNPRLAGSETGASVTMTTDWVSLIGVQFPQSEFVEVK
jgi:hypothetical protein